MRAEHLAQLAMKQVERRVIAAYRLAACRIYFRTHGVAYADNATAERAKVQVNTVSLFGVVNYYLQVVGADDTAVADLSAALTVKGSAVKHEREVAFRDLLAKHFVRDYRNYLCVGPVFGVTGVFGLGQTGKQILLRGIPTAHVAACGAGAVALLKHKSLKALVVHLKSRFLGDLAREVNGEAVGVVELEHTVAGKKAFVLLLGVRYHAGKNVKSRVNGGVEALLFDGDDLHDIVALCIKLGVSLVVFAYGDGKYVGKELTVDAAPASVAFDTLSSAKANNADVVIIDTAGRLHNKIGLMNELTKIKNVMKKVVPDAPHEVLLVLDGSTGQNAFEQAKQFTLATEVTAMAITKLDGTAKGGVVIGISDQFKIPVRYIGLGEGMEDLQIFRRREFVDSLFGSTTEK